MAERSLTLRNADELKALKALGAYDAAIWVDASKRQAVEASASCTVEPSMADYVLNNNGREDELPDRVRSLMAKVLADLGA